jgi:hypothetical protein
MSSRPATIKPAHARYCQGSQLLASHTRNDAPHNATPIALSTTIESDAPLGVQWWQFPFKSLGFFCIENVNHILGTFAVSGQGFKSIPGTVGARRGRGREERKGVGSDNAAQTTAASICCACKQCESSLARAGSCSARHNVPRAQEHVVHRHRSLRRAAERAARAADGSRGGQPPPRRLVHVLCRCCASSVRQRLRW